MSDYKPVSCELYAQFEHWIVRRQRLRVAWLEDTRRAHVESLQPLDLRTREHAEYLVARRSGGGRVELRLDHIVRAQPL
jgi:Rho-binding antiterminator